MRTRHRALTAISGIALVLLALAATYVVVRGYPTEIRARLAEHGTPARVVDLHDVGQLQAAFNADAGTARLVVLFSPT
jgi:hypothetical protein